MTLITPLVSPQLTSPHAGFCARYDGQRQRLGKGTRGPASLLARIRAEGSGGPPPLVPRWSLQPGMTALTHGRMREPSRARSFSFTQRETRRQNERTKVLDHWGPAPAKSVYAERDSRRQNERTKILDHWGPAPAKSAPPYTTPPPSRYEGDMREIA